MRDIIWTLIIVWLVYRLVDVFRSIQAKRSSDSYGSSQNHHANSSRSDSGTAAAPKRDIKTAVQKHLNNEGEYVDFEEVK